MGNWIQTHHSLAGVIGLLVADFAIIAALIVVTRKYRH